MKKDGRKHPQIIAVVCEKGGTGKTTTAEAITDGLTERGYKVLCVDLDQQGDITAAMRADRAKPGTYQLLTGTATAQEAIQRTERAYIIAGSRDLATLQTKPTALREALQGIQFDYVVIDCPPAMGLLSINALTAADGAVIPATADAYSLMALGNLQHTFDAVRQHANPDLALTGILLTRYVGRTVITRELTEVMEQVAGQLHTKVFKTKIRECTAIREAQARRESIFKYAARNAAADYNAFIDELLNEHGRR